MPRVYLSLAECKKCNGVSVSNNLFCTHLHSARVSKYCEKPRDNPCHDALQHDDKHSVAVAQLTADGGDSGHARRVEQAEDHQTDSGRTAQDGRERQAGRQRFKGADDTLLGHKTRNKGGRHAPVAEAQR